jgi:hypothetical protein
MLWEILKAIFVGGIPVAIFTFLVVQWSIVSGRMDKLSGTQGLEKQHRGHAKKARKDKRINPDSRVGNMLHNKIVSFGGGYYGTMAVLTYALIECVEILQFLASIFDPDTWINRLGVELLVEFLVNSITNLVAAFVWFSTLPAYIRIENGWIWLAVTYGAYWLALQITVAAGDSLWNRLIALVRRRS